MANREKGTCEHCNHAFVYESWHTGFSDLAYAYCDACGMLATLNAWNPEMKRLPANVGWHHEINREVEPFLLPCACGGRFCKGASPRCPYCNMSLSAELAATYIELNAPGTAKGLALAEELERSLLHGNRRSE
jgi:hypothetical protein